jgi:uncharacterized protein YecT (DUF1311 family)
MMLFAMLLAASGQDCANAMTQSDMNRCATADLAKADAALNRQWKLTLAGMREADRQPHKDGRPGYADQLLKAQRAWLAYRDAHCVSDGYVMRGGSAEPMLQAGCRARLTEERTKQLAHLIAEGG